MQRSEVSERLIRSLLTPGRQYTQWFTEQKGSELGEEWSLWPHVDPKTPGMPVELRFRSVVRNDDGELEEGMFQDMPFTPDQADQLAKDLHQAAELSRRLQKAAAERDKEEAEFRTIDEIVITDEMVKKAIIAFNWAYSHELTAGGPLPGNAMRAALESVFKGQGAE